MKYGSPSFLDNFLVSRYYFPLTKTVFLSHCVFLAEIYL